MSRAYRICISFDGMKFHKITTRTEHIGTTACQLYLCVRVCACVCIWKDEKNIRHIRFALNTKSSKIFTYDTYIYCRLHIFSVSIVVWDSILPFHPLYKYFHSIRFSYINKYMRVLDNTMHQSHQFVSQGAQVYTLYSTLFALMLNHKSTFEYLCRRYACAVHTFYSIKCAIHKTEKEKKKCWVRLFWHLRVYRSPCTQDCLVWYNWISCYLIFVTNNHQWNKRLLRFPFVSTNQCHHSQNKMR